MSKQNLTDNIHQTIYGEADAASRLLRAFADNEERRTNGRFNDAQSANMAALLSVDKTTQLGLN